MGSWPEICRRLEIPVTGLAGTGVHLKSFEDFEQAAIYWEFDHAMWLHPSPDVLVLCDKQQQWQHTYEDTQAFNPGSFVNDSSWMVYRPAGKELEASSLE